VLAWMYFGDDILVSCSFSQGQVSGLGRLRAAIYIDGNLLIISAPAQPEGLDFPSVFQFSSCSLRTCLLSSGRSMSFLTRGKIRR
jgi:hypothetical protein